MNCNKSYSPAWHCTPAASVRSRALAFSNWVIPLFHLSFASRSRASIVSKSANSPHCAALLSVAQPIRSSDSTRAARVEQVMRGGVVAVERGVVVLIGVVAVLIGEEVAAVVVEVMSNVVVSSMVGVVLIGYEVVKG